MHEHNEGLLKPIAIMWITSCINPDELKLIKLSCCCLHPFSRISKQLMSIFVFILINIFVNIKMCMVKTQAISHLAFVMICVI